MSARSLFGLVLLNALVFGTGAGVLWAIRGWRSWVELARLSGLAYMVGVAAVGVTLSLELVAGVPFSFATVVLTCAALAGLGVGVGRALGRRAPAVRGARPGVGVVAAAYGALAVVYLEALFRAGRLSSLSNWDGWAFWVPKAKAIHYFDGLDEQFFRELANPTYPPLLPALEASAFAFMGSADVVTLHVQLWFFLVGFVGAVAGLLAPRVAPLLLWPALVLVLVAPRVVSRTLEPQADFLLDYLFALAALLVALWLVERAPWQLAAASIFLAAAMLTKREGQLLAACVVVAALAAGWRERRLVLPRIAFAGGTALALALPWRAWFSSRGLTGELPEGGPAALVEHADRAWPSVRSVVDAMFEYDLWLLVLPLATVAIALAFLGGARVLPTYAALVYGLAATGFVWVLWSFTELELPLVQDEGVNPIVRLTGSLVILSGALVPLLLEAAWTGADRPRTSSAATPRRLAPVLVLLAALAYPLGTLAQGTPHFPSRDECVRPATGEGEVEAVFGRFESEREAVDLRDRALVVGFQGTEAVRDACGRVKVVLPGVPSLEVGREFAEQAQSVGFEVSLEQPG